MSGIAWFLIGLSVGCLFFDAVNYYSKTHQRIIPTPYILIIGVAALVIGLII